MSKTLADINSPADLRDMTLSELRDLAAEARKQIIATTSESGGHLAPNLGVVELTIALHRVLHTPTDKIIWDVGHQCYTHKLLTGRREAFPTIRQMGGLSGFPRRDESPHDAFGTGHGSTSISAALGFARARDLRGGSERIVAVIGDGALTGGLALEALNQAGASKADLLVVLNDNEMSIGRNVGAMSSYLAKVRAGYLEPAVDKARRDVAKVLRNLPLGDAMLEAADRLRDGFKQLVVPGMLFEELGFTYLGPVDGHDIGELTDLFQHALRLRGPVLVHAITQKGRGYTPAENDPSRFHGTKPFNISNGECAPQKGPVTYSQVLGQVAMELAEKDKRVVAVSAAMLDGTGLACFRNAFPDRCFDVGMTEEHAVTFAAGLAAAGLRPIVAIYSTFLQRSYDQIIHDVALQDLPVIFALDRAGLVGDDGPTHHGVFDLSFLRQIPGMVVMAPANEAEMRDMLHTALALDGPSSVRYPRSQGLGMALDREPEIIPIGRAQTLREGDAATILAIGHSVGPALAAAEVLATEGIACGVVNARFAKPLDAELLTSLAQAGRPLVTVEENALAGGFGAGVVEFLADQGLGGAPIRRVGLPDRFIEHGDTAALYARYGLDAAGIAAAVRELLG